MFFLFHHQIGDDTRKARSIPEHKVIFNEFWKVNIGRSPDTYHAHVCDSICFSQKKLTKSLEANEASFKPTTLTADNLPPDVYTWKWYYTCGARYIIVGAGVSECVCVIRDQYILPLRDSCQTQFYHALYFTFFCTHFIALPPQRLDSKRTT